MSIIEVLLLAVALSIDACIVSFSYGLIIKEKRLKNALLLAGYTGFFQALMPVFGYYLADFVKVFILPYSKIIVFLIFALLGIQFIKDALTKKEENINTECLSAGCLLVVAVATSIDAFSAGISLLLSDTKFLIPIILFGIITFINAILGFFITEKFKKLNTKILQISGGTILISLALYTILA